MPGFKYSEKLTNVAKEEVRRLNEQSDEYLEKMRVEVAGANNSDVIRILDDHLDFLKQQRIDLRKQFGF